MSSRKESVKRARDPKLVKSYSCKKIIDCCLFLSQLKVSLLLLLFPIPLTFIDAIFSSAITTVNCKVLF